MIRDDQAGFSLLEVLVVLAMLATMAGVTVMSFGSGGNDSQLESEVKLLANRLSLATDEALVTDKEFSLDFDAAGYGVDVWSAGTQEWTPSENASFGARHELPDGISLHVDTSLERVVIRPDAAGDPLTLTVSSSSDNWHVSHDGFSARAWHGER